MKITPTYTRLKDGYHAVVEIDGVQGISNVAHLYRQDAQDEADFAARRGATITGATLDGSRRKAHTSYTVTRAPMRTSGMVERTSNKAMVIFGAVLCFVCLFGGLFVMLS